MPFPYDEFDLSGVRTYPLKSRESKVRVDDFATIGRIVVLQNGRQARLDVVALVSARHHDAHRRERCLSHRTRPARR